MHLDEYIKSIQSCPDEKVGNDWMLTYEYGIYDNFPIMMSGDYQVMFEFLKKHFTVIEEDSVNCYARLNYNPGTVNVQISKGTRCGMITPEIWSPEDNRKQKETYNMSVMLHRYQEKKIPDKNDIRAIADVVVLIGQWAIDNHIPLCLSSSAGTKDVRDMSKIVYSNDT